MSAGVYRLVKISYQEYQMLAEAGVWVQWDVEPLEEEDRVLAWGSSTTSVDPYSLFRPAEEYTWYTRAEVPEEA